MNAATRTQPQTPQQLVALATQHAAYFNPGTGWHYSNTNFILLGMIVKKITQGSLSAALQMNAIDAAKLAHTFFDGEQTITGTLASGFDTSGTDVTHLYNPSWAWADGAMVSTTGELADWVTALYGGAVLDDSARAELTANPVTTDQGETYGLGTMIFPYSATGGAGVAYGHNGDISGYHSMAYYFPKEKTSIAVVVTADGADPNDPFVSALGVLLGY